jgi:hypothetical protein
MVHWVYILRCTGETEDWTSKGVNDRVYIGETTRLFTRLREHTVREVGSCTTSEFYPNRLMGLYKVEDDLLYINNNENSIHHKMYNEGYIEKLENKTDAMNLENTLTEMYMQAMGPKWKNVYGGKYHAGYRPYDNPGAKAEFNRPYCNCKIPADIKEYNGKKYWRCSVKNIWEDLEIYIINELGLNLQNIVEPCKFYKEYNQEDNFECEKLIYNYPIDKIKLTGKCLILDDSDDE